MIDDDFVREQKLKMIKSACFHDQSLHNWSFDNDNGKCSNIKEAKLEFVVDSITDKDIDFAHDAIAGIVTKISN